MSQPGLLPGGMHTQGQRPCTADESCHTERGNDWLSTFAPIYVSKVLIAALLTVQQFLRAYQCLHSRSSVQQPCRPLQDWAESPARHNLHTISVKQLVSCYAPLFKVERAKHYTGRNRKDYSCQREI